jgi:sugar phosphate isomerase/epimerase
VATLETAARIGARAVVLHLGRVAVEEGVLAPYRGRIAEESPAFDRIRESVGPLLAARERLRPPHFDAVLRSVERLNREALRRGLLLGLENRFHPHEMPNHEELGLLLQEFAGGAVRAWFDTGHAAFQERLGLLPRLAWLEAYGVACAGAHLHDIRGTNDHLPPGTGEEDFGAILRLLPAGALRVVEVRAGTSREELIAGRRFLERLGY